LFGTFSNIAGVAMKNIASFNGEDWNALGSFLPPDSGTIAFTALSLGSSKALFAGGTDIPRIDADYEFNLIRFNGGQKKWFDAANIDNVVDMGPKIDR